MSAPPPLWTDLRGIMPNFYVFHVIHEIKSVDLRDWSSFWIITGVEPIEFYSIPGLIYMLDMKHMDSAKKYSRLVMRAWLKTEEYIFYLKWYFRRIIFKISGHYKWTIK